MPGTQRTLVRGASLAAACLLALTACVAPGPQEGMRAYQRHEYEAAVASWTPSAESGDPVSQFCLGTMYEDGRGVDVDLALAHEYYLRAAAQGLPEAQLNVGRMYAQGRGVDASFERARVWFERAARGGDALGHRNLGVMYLKGYGVVQDVERAREHFERAADEDPFSARVLGSLHEEELVAGGPELGEEWLIAAAAGGDVAARSDLGTRLLQRGDEAGAARWLALAAEGGDSAAQLLYGWMLQSGRRDLDRDGGEHRRTGRPGERGLRPRVLRERLARSRTGPRRGALDAPGRGRGHHGGALQPRAHDAARPGRRALVPHGRASPPAGRRRRLPARAEAAARARRGRPPRPRELGQPRGMIRKRSAPFSSGPIGSISMSTSKRPASPRRSPTTIGARPSRDDS